MASENYVGKTAYYGEVAARYDADRRVEPLWEQEQAFVQAWAANVAEGTTVLDIPTGTGRFLEIFHARGLHVLAQDISEDMLAEIRRLHPSVDPSRLQISKGDAEAIALPDASVDVVVSWRFVHLIPMPVVRQVMREFRRVCRGPVVVQVFAVEPRPERGPLVKTVKALLRPLWRLLKARGAAAAPATPWAHISSFSHREQHLLAAFAQAGLHVDRTHTFDPAARFPTRVYFLSSR